MSTEQHGSAFALCKALLAALAADRPDLIPEAASLHSKLSPRRHSPDFASVSWDGTTYVFTSTQAAAVATLWHAMENRTPEMGQSAILEEAGSVGKSLEALFTLAGGRDRDSGKTNPKVVHPAWGVLIIPGKAKGTFRLAE